MPNWITSLSSEADALTDNCDASYATPITFILCNEYSPT